MNVLDKVVSTGVVVGLAVLGATACGAQTGKSASTSQPKSHVVKDSYGHSVRVPVDPKRVVAPDFEVPLLVLGIKPAAQESTSGSQPEYEYLQPQLKGVPTVNFTGGLKPEDALKFNPDLIILDNSNWVTTDLYKQFTKVALTYEFNNTVSGSNPWPNHWRNDLLKLGKIFNKSTVAHQAIQNYDKQAAAAKVKVHQAIGDKSVALLYLSGKTLAVMGTGWWDSAPVLYDDLKLTPPAFSIGKSYDQISLEELPKMKADYIFLIDADTSMSSNPLFSNPVWKNLSAVQQGHMFKVSGSSSFFGMGAITNALTIKTVVKDLTK
ncbi:ABC transporter substrate-binding protein [Alicyclobacillus fodiniaquatilis]|uniref:ABC transporter substrate-binding protein n=1 Tax=Alicyclobacillus fodiniaquatilis TaxID=1661150 RepID=A0ABW4JQS5_9BACL